ncbi:FAD-binding and (Fe-S)-binding domain-containing protein [Haloarchaeobius iranensis]|uniref:D-lactate dehydrogenase (cytochrome) n=1 Tax=Haloarchaeobius iranensis TaxID=996166 RepID=A0A1G9ZT44_9EURY|nr:FAD-binding and (Fe-S)-binding domain-containing protein [Haloarchaeobius iranensis]SDN24772.1 FAD/FMN-containing dehydrogenase [Haloarchaeobius iranensis]
MASDPDAVDQDAPRDARDAAATYDYRSDDVTRPDILDALSTRVDGDVRFDSYSRQLYATDASIYEQLPVGVVFPQSTDDVAAVVAYCADEGIPVLPRGGGTSLAGQTVNEAVVLDFTRYMDSVESLDPDARRARVQPGGRLGDLNDRLADHGLKFAPDPAWGDKSALGGAIGNNSTGAHSLRYGKTDAYVESCEVVLADGTVTEFGEISTEELRERADPDGDLEARIHAEVARVLDEEADEIRERYPELKRNVSGYNLDWLVEDATGATRDVGEPDADGGTVNLAKLLCGSEGTLAVVTEATVALEPVPETKSLALLCYDDLVTAMADVPAILDHDPAAVELVDEVLLDLARDTAEFADVAGQLPEGTRATLLVEFYADDDAAGERAVADLLADRVPAAVEGSDDGAGGDDPARAFDAVEAHDDAERAKIWKLRKSGLPILLSRTSDAKHVSFIEDTAVPPDSLPEFVEGFREILDDHDTFASFYAHAGPGVLHVRPLVNTKTAEGIEAMESIADAVTDLVVDLGGSVSGEHGDGRARTQWNRKLYGDGLWETFRDLKTAFDPDWLLNPGQVCGDVSMTEELRSGPEYEFDAGFEPELEWANENGFQGMVELCHGCGGCRGDQHTTGGVMCPTYRASREEITSTRGRANMLRSAMAGDLPDDGFGDEFVDEVLDLCIGCKGCAHDCPSEVDMAKLKAEVVHEHHEREGVPLRDRLFGRIHDLSRVGSALAPVSNWLADLGPARALGERLLGIDADRSLPTFHRKTFRDRFAARGGPAVPEHEAERRVLLYPDTHTNYTDPDAGMAAVEVLEAAGVHVRVPDEVGDTGRPVYSKGLLDAARATARENVARLAPRVRDGWDVVLVEPSNAVMLQSDYPDLLDGDSVDDLADATYGVCEYLDAFRLDDAIAFDAPEGPLTYHGHCHQKATAKDHHAVGVLRRAGYDVDPLDSTCCGMAGSFGYEAEHRGMSAAIAGILYDQVDESPGDRVVAPGASCRTQLADRDVLGDGDDASEPPTPVELLASALER